MPSPSKSDCPAVSTFSKRLLASVNALKSSTLVSPLITAATAPPIAFCELAAIAFAVTDVGFTETSAAAVLIFEIN